MNVCRFLLIAAALSILSHGSTQAQEPSSTDTKPAPSLFDSPKDSRGYRRGTSQSDVRRSRMSVSELRQTRALYRANQRAARIEHNLWIGYEPLRPNFGSIPMTSSRYPNRRIYVPVYLYHR